MHIFRAMHIFLMGIFANSHHLIPLMPCTYLVGSELAGNIDFSAGVKILLFIFLRYIREFFLKLIRELHFGRELFFSAVLSFFPNKCQAESSSFLVAFCARALLLFFFFSLVYGWPGTPVCRLRNHPRPFSWGLVDRWVRGKDFPCFVIFNTLEGI